MSREQDEVDHSSIHSPSFIMYVRHVFLYAVAFSLSRTSLLNDAIGTSTIDSDEAAAAAAAATAPLDSSLASPLLVGPRSSLGGGDLALRAMSEGEDCCVGLCES